MIKCYFYNQHMLTFLEKGIIIAARISSDFKQHLPSEVKNVSSIIICLSEPIQFKWVSLIQL